MWKTLRFRLAAWNVAVVACTALITLAGLRQGVRWGMLHEMDQVLTEDIEEISLSLSSLASDDLTGLESNLQRKAQGHRHHQWFVQLLDSTQQILSGSELSSPPPDFSGGEMNIPRTIAGYRVVERRLPETSHGVRTIRVGASLSLMRQDIARIDRLVLLAAGVVLVCAPVLGFWLAGRAVRTIGDIIQTAARLRPSHLEERLPVRGTGDELDQLAQTVNSLLDRIAVYLAQKRDFLANSAHELRTPLAAIRSSVEVALSSDRTQGEYEDLLVEIIDQGTMLETLVNQLLLISESEAEQLQHELETVLFNDILQRSLQMFEGVAEVRGVKLKAASAGPLLIRGSPHLLRQLVNNLLDNAIKYTPAGGQVTAELCPSDDHRQAVFRVKDTGPGIPREDVSRVFDRFFRADKARSRADAAVGTGLGLSICQAVVTAHDGTITCASELGVGSTFEVRLPLADSSQAVTERIRDNRDDNPQT